MAVSFRRTKDVNRSPISPDENRKIIETAVCLQLSGWQICTVPTVRVETLTNYPSQAELFSKNDGHLARTNALGLLLSPKVQYYDVNKKKTDTGTYPDALESSSGLCSVLLIRLDVLP